MLIERRDTTGVKSEDLPQLRLVKLGFVFQFHFVLLPEFSVIGNVMVSMRKLGALTEREMRERAGAISTSWA